MKKTNLSAATASVSAVGGNVMGTMTVAMAQTRPTAVRT